MLPCDVGQLDLLDATPGMLLYSSGPEFEARREFTSVSIGGVRSPDTAVRSVEVPDLESEL